MSHSSKKPCSGVSGAIPAVSVANTGNGAKRPLLDLSTTYDHENRTTTRIFTYPDGSMEMGYSCGNNTSQTPKPAKGIPSSHSSLRRSKSQVRRLIQSMPGRAFLTLTYAENMTDYKQAEADLSLFRRRAKRKYGKFDFVAVAETQKRGAWHWHLILDGFYPYREIRNLWPHGFIDIRKVQNAKQAARYLTKYVAKTFDQDWPPSKPRYVRTRGIHVQEQRLQFKNTHDALDHFYKLTDGVYSYHWQEDGNGFITS